MKPIHSIIVFGHIMIALFICGIVNTCYKKWQEIEAWESDKRQIDELRKEINNIYIPIDRVFSIR